LIGGNGAAHRVDGITYNFERFIDAKSDLQLAASASK
jgi:hypothetical protein